MTTTNKFLASMLLTIISVICVKAQDTLVMKNGTRKIVQVTEMSDTEIKYKDVTFLEGPVMVTPRHHISKVCFRNGLVMNIKNDPLDIHAEREIINKKSAYKIQPFGLAMKHLAVGYERVIKPTFNFEGKLGIIFGAGQNDYSANKQENGFFIKPGFKFLLGTDYVINGMKYSHLLKGRYIKLEPFFTHMSKPDQKYYESKPVSYQYGYTSYESVEKTVDVKVNSIGMHIIYGRQFILANVITFDYYVGLGMAGTNTNVADWYRPRALHSHFDAGNNLSFCWGLSLGIIGN